MLIRFASQGAMAAWCIANSPAAAETERGVRTGFLDSCRR
jgi:hypothetical protein